MACQSTISGYKCEKDKVITISSPLVPSNPLTEHIWTIDGVSESTAASFQKTYAAPGFHTVVHSGKNACLGECAPQSVQLEIADVITPPTTTTAAPPSAAPMIIGAVIALAFLGIVMMKK